MALAVPTRDAYIASRIPIEGHLRQLFPDLDARVIFDIGSCEGEDAIRYSNLFPQATVYAFEPVPANLELLRGNLARWSKSNIEVREVALSDEQGSAELHVSSGRPPRAPISDWDYGNKSSSLLQPEKHLEVHPWVHFDETITVRTDTIADVVEAEGLDHIDFVHLDVQGAELNVLRGAGPFLERIGAIWLEVEAIPLYTGQPLKGDVEAFMAAHGFRLMTSTVNAVSGDQLYFNPRLIHLSEPAPAPKGAPGAPSAPSAPSATQPASARGVRRRVKGQLRRVPGARRVARRARRLRRLRIGRPSLGLLTRPLFRRVAGRRRSQGFFRAMHRLSVAGLNMGSAADKPASSGELAVIKALPEQPIVFDVGANVGDYAAVVLAARPDAQLWCFEPSATAFERLTGVLAGRGAAMQIGLGDADGEAQLFAPTTGSPLGSVFQRSHPSIRFKPTETVRLRTLDDVFRELALDRIDLLKLDVEGNELAALRGARETLRSGAITAIQFEFGGSNIDSRTYLRDFFDLLEPAYRIHRIVRDGVVPLRYEELWEVFTTTNFLAIRSERRETT